MKWKRAARQPLSHLHQDGWKAPCVGHTLRSMWLPWPSVRLAQKEEARPPLAQGRHLTVSMPCPLSCYGRPVTADDEGRGWGGTLAPESIMIVWEESYRRILVTA